MLIVTGFEDYHVNDLIQFDITMHHDYIKFILGIFIKLYKQATFFKKLKIINNNKKKNLTN